MRRESSTISTVGLAAGAPDWDSDIALFFISIPQGKPVRALVDASLESIAVGRGRNFTNQVTLLLFATATPIQGSHQRKTPPMAGFCVPEQAVSG
jgi:hypothetical protein